ncbi:MAG TPA: HEAT repeat domain-containing protein, partial [Kofleriaceae bacterium]|nr:HEAT repeat domain-containing protein [Kofleriaceae bacterium]
KAKVGPPAVTGHTLGFWVLTTDPPPQVEHGQLDLSNGLLELQPLPLPPKLAIDRAMITLGSVAVSRHLPAIRTLAAACADARARQALLGALASHPRIKVRAAAADEAHRCGPAAIDTLVTAMEQDKSALVRREAAGALGRIGDARARPALAKAARGEDANLAWAAGNALKKLR